MFTKVLVANRGEIAVRIIRACHELGIDTVAVYSEVDRAAMHVRQAGEAYLLGPAPSRDSYLRADKLIEIAGVARATVAAAGVPVVPGTEGEGDLSDEALLTLAPDIGFPLLIKATAGGGGKGMREVGRLEDMPDLLQSARREAEAAFGDGNVYLEKLLLDARHIEFQVIADSHMDEELRKEMGELACRAAKAVDYLNAGTIEFLVDKDRNFFFLEMNTRLQVEHPITEMITGVDIVREQIRVARGRKLRYAQEDIALNGWAIECRINAEDPYNNFLPSTGQLTSVIPPSGPGVRVDTGVYAGFTITPHYDSLISKLICWGETRGEAILRMRRALDEFRILGVRTNIPFHQKLLASPRFMAGQFDTRFVEERFKFEEGDEEQENLEIIAALMATLVAHRERQEAAEIIQQSERDTSNWKWVGRWERMQR
jgi:acetyl/propionyl-CoA carboxylase alpha subunit